MWPQVIKEPIVNEATATSSDPGLRLDLGIRGVWQPQVEALSIVRSEKKKYKPNKYHNFTSTVQAWL